MNYAPPYTTDQPVVVPQLRPLPVTNTPLVGKNGLFVWPVSWQLTANSANGGWIIQQVNITVKDYRKDGTMARPETVKYWEAWQVNQGTNSPIAAETLGTSKPMRDWIFEHVVNFLSPQQFVSVVTEASKGQWAPANDFFSYMPFEVLGKPMFPNSSGLPPTIVKRTVTITGSAFYVAYPNLPPNTMNTTNVREAGGLLSISAISPNASAMTAWIALAQKYGLVSNVVNRSVLAVWTSQRNSVPIVLVWPPPTAGTRAAWANLLAFY